LFVKNIVFTAARCDAVAMRGKSFKINDLRSFSLNCPRGPEIHGPRPAGPAPPNSFAFLQSPHRFALPYCNG
jgi:hypothetical protein